MYESEYQEDESLIAEYFNLPKAIAKVEQHLERANEMFWQRSFTISPMAIDETGYRAKTKPYVSLVDDLVVFQEYMEERIKMLEYKQRKFTEYLSSLSKDDSELIKRKYLFKQNAYVNDHLEMAVYSECILINADSKTRFNRLEEIATDISNDYKRNLDDIIEMLV